MRKYVMLASMVAALVGCGGGGGEDEAGQPLGSAPDRGSIQQKAVNTGTASMPGTPQTRSVGALNNGGHVVAWAAEGAAYLQRYNKPGHRVGEAVQLPVPSDPPITGYVYQHPPPSPQPVVQATGEVAVVYHRVRPASQVDPTVTDPSQQHLGLYLQRFSATGTLVQGETEIVSMLRFVPGAVHFVEGVRVLALSDGSFVVSWGVAYRGGLGATQVDYFMQRFSSSGVPVGGRLIPVVNYWCANRHLNSHFEWEADDAGGFRVHGTIFPRQFDGEHPCGGYGPPVERQVDTYFAAAHGPVGSKQDRHKACLQLAAGLKGQERKERVDRCLAQ